MRLLCVTLIALTLGLAATAGAVVPQPGDVFMLDDSNVLWLVDAQTGERIPVSSPGASVLCIGTGEPYECCTGVGIGMGTGVCVEIGTGPSWHQGFSSGPSGGVAVLPNGDVVVPAFPRGGAQPTLLYGFSAVSGTRTVLSSPDLTAQCTGPGVPIECCTGTGVSDGTPPCAEVGSGPQFANWNGKFLPTASAVPATVPVAVTSLPTWGLALLAGVLLGISIRSVRRGRTA